MVCIQPFMQRPYTGSAVAELVIVEGNVFVQVLESAHAS